MQNAKNYIVSGIKTIETEQDTQIVFYIGQEISKIRYSINEYINSINSVTKDQVIEFAKNLQVNTIYFLTNQEETKKVQNQNDEDI